jgi:hypothetical protein
MVVEFRDRSGVSRSMSGNDGMVGGSDIFGQP